MKTNKFTIILGTLSLLISSSYAEVSGEELYKAKCASCHLMERPSDKSTMIAPPIMGVTMHVKMNYDTKEKAVEFIKSYALNPDRSKSVCEAEKIKRFGLMPSQKGNATEEELSIIASWMYDTFDNQGKCKGKGNCKGKGKCNGMGKQKGMQKGNKGKRGCGRGK